MWLKLKYTATRRATFHHVRINPAGNGSRRRGCNNTTMPYCEAFQGSVNRVKVCDSLTWQAILWLSMRQDRDGQGEVLPNLTASPVRQRSESALHLQSAVKT